MPKVQRFLDISVTSKKKMRLSGSGLLDINVYIEGLRSIIDVLECDDPNLWNVNSMTKFEILDYFLWHIGKAGQKSYSLLLTKNEMLNAYSDGNLNKLPQRVILWEQFYHQL